MYRKLFKKFFIVFITLFFLLRGVKRLDIIIDQSRFQSESFEILNYHLLFYVGTLRTLSKENSK